MYELAEFRSVITEQKHRKTYAVLAGDYGVNQNYLWKIINVPDYVPPAWVCAKLDIRYYVQVVACSACGKSHNIDRACELQVTVKVKRTPKQPRHQFGWLMSFYETKKWAEIIHE